MGWKHDESGTGEGVLTLSKLGENYRKFQYKSVSSNILFWRKFILAKTCDLGFKIMVVDVALLC